MVKNKYIKSHFLPTTIKMTPVYLVNLLVQITKFPHLITTLGYMILSKTHQFINSINTYNLIKLCKCKATKDNSKLP